MTRDGDIPLEGGCTCGAVRYRMIGKPMFVYCCHCRECQRGTGAAFGLNAMIEADRVALLQGQPEMVPVPTPSGRGQMINRCPTCRVALWGNYFRAGDKVHFIRVGTLDQPDLVSPDIHIYTASKLPWVVIPEGTPTFPEYYSAGEVWPAESLARMKALKG
jgi:hypothetical protein